MLAFLALFQALAAPSLGSLALVSVPDTTKAGTGDVVLTNLSQEPFAITGFDLVGPAKWTSEPVTTTLTPGQKLTLPLTWSAPEKLPVQVLVRTEAGTFVARLHLKADTTTDRLALWLSGPGRRGITALGARDFVLDHPGGHGLSTPDPTGFRRRVGHAHNLAGLRPVELSARERLAEHRKVRQGPADPQEIAGGSRRQFEDHRCILVNRRVPERAVPALCHLGEQDGELMLRAALGPAGDDEALIEGASGGEGVAGLGSDERHTKYLSC